jgi:hypothetical protein
MDDNFQEYECRNHLKVVHEIGDGLLYVCGTNGYDPKDYVIYVSDYWLDKCTIGRTYLCMCTVLN